MLLKFEFWKRHRDTYVSLERFQNYREWMETTKFSKEVYKIFIKFDFKAYVGDDRR